ncbi:MAG: sigma-70 family RNA polymerase sigma factor [Lachnospiraceae bacterium]
MDLREKVKKTCLFFIGHLEKEEEVGAIYYIGGTDVLPAPLDSIKENEMLEALSTEDNQAAKNMLIEHNLRLVVYIAKKFDNTGVGVEDLISIGTIGLMKAINTYKLEKNIKLATYASRCIENEILMYLRKISKNKMEVSIDEPLNTDFDGNELLLSDILGTGEDETSKGMEVQAEKMILFHSIEKLSKREKKIICLRFGLHNIRVNEKNKVVIEEREEMTQKEVATLLGISQSYISRLEKKIMKQLKKEILKES